ncbi:hypothetical protein B0T19DRAFT_465549 [Cercophora scortea]|uniref:LysM domain-containing protein n=1 Tax=Cercophora scortea TaxID=314031 RepID=A0AAE0I8U9_9PEZI|nr:hypothetical protein B0T19DRAFT_465549 [Cercophora scortea]
MSPSKTAGPAQKPRTRRKKRRKTRGAPSTSSALLSLPDLLKWNTWLSNTPTADNPTDSDADCTRNLFADLASYGHRAVCIDAVAGTAPDPGDIAMPWVQAGVTAHCEMLVQVSFARDCELLERVYKISAEDFLRWNPAVGSNCDNMLPNYSYCVKGPA